MRHPSNSTDRSAANPMGAIVIGLIGAVAMAALTLATGHGLGLAALAYALSGALFMTAAAAGRLAITVAGNRMASTRTRRTRRGDTAAA